MPRRLRPCSPAPSRCTRPRATTSESINVVYSKRGSDTAGSKPTTASAPTAATAVANITSRSTRSASDRGDRRHHRQHRADDSGHHRRTRRQEVAVQPDHRPADGECDSAEDHRAPADARGEGPGVGGRDGHRPQLPHGVGHEPEHGRDQDARPAQRHETTDQCGQRALPQPRDPRAHAGPRSLPHGSSSRRGLGHAEEGYSRRLASDGLVRRASSSTSRCRVAVRISSSSPASASTSPRGSTTIE